MRCFSQLLSHVLKEFDAKHRGAGCGASPALRISTHPLLPELVEQDLGPWSRSISDLLVETANHAAPGNPIKLHVEPGRGVADLCVLKFKIQFETLVPEVEYQQIIRNIHARITENGAWVNVSSFGEDLIEIVIELSLKAVLPQAVSAFPSWLFGRSVLLIGASTAENLSMQHSLQQAGGQVKLVEWDGNETIRMLSTSMEGEFRHAFMLVDLNSITGDVARTEEILRQFVIAGLVVDSFDLAFAVAPGVWEKLSDLIKVQIGQRLLQHPLTLHLLKSPRSVFHQAPNLALRELVLSPTNSDALDLNVLLVEDCQLTSSLIANYLTSRGARVMQAVDKFTALEIAKQNKFDIYLVDLHLPDEPGFELAKALRKTGNNSDAPILAITASRSIADYRACYRSGMDDCLTKPLNFADMVGKIRCWSQTSLTSRRVEVLTEYQAAL